MSARNNFWQNVNRLKSPSIYAVLNDVEKIELASCIDEVTKSNTLMNPTGAFQYAINLIESVNNRLNEYTESHFKMYKQ